MISSNRTAPSSSRGTDCGIFWIDVYPFFSRIGMEEGDSVTASFSCGFAFAAIFPVALGSTFSMEMVSDVSVTYLLIPFTIRTHEAVPSRHRDSIKISMPVTFLMKTDIYIQDRDDLRVSENPPSCTGMASSHRSSVYSRHRFFISFGPSSSRVTKRCPFITISGSCSNFRSYSCSKFPCSSASV